MSEHDGSYDVHLVAGEPVIVAWDGRTYYFLHDALFRENTPYFGASDLERELAVTRLRMWADKIEAEGVEVRLGAKAVAS